MVVCFISDANVVVEWLLFVLTDTQKTFEKKDRKAISKGYVRSL